MSSLTLLRELKLGKRYCLELTGCYACFTRPEMKVERVSYDIITPSAARACFESILWKPAIQWRIRQIDVLKPIRWMSVRRNEVASMVSARNVQTAMNSGKGDLGLYIEDERQQRASLLLRDVAYRVHADLMFIPERDPQSQAQKYHEMFERRAKKGQCVNQPYLGCREFSADFRLIESLEGEPTPVCETKDLGFMLHDFDFSNRAAPQPRFFRAQMTNGVVSVPAFHSDEVHA